MIQDLQHWTKSIAEIDEVIYDTYVLEQWPDSVTLDQPVVGAEFIERENANSKTL